MRFFGFGIFAVFLCLCPGTLGLRAEEPLSYVVSFHGITDDSLLERIESASLLVSLADKPPASVAGLSRRIKGDEAIIRRTLQRAGYFAPEISYDLLRDDSGFRVYFGIDTGAAYESGELFLEWADPVPPDLPEINALRLPTGADDHAATPEQVLQIEREIFNILMRQGYPAPTVLRRILHVDHTTRRVDARLVLSAGRAAVFGDTQITGLERTKESFIRRRMAWQEGETYNLEKISRTRNALRQTGVVTLGAARHGDISEDGEIPIFLDLQESPARTIGAGVRYATTQDLSGQVFWEHRNLWGEAERLRLESHAGTQSYGLSADLDIPDLFGRLALGWQNTGRYAHEDLEAFERQGFQLLTRLRYGLTPDITVNGGISLEHNQITSAGQKNTVFNIIGFPIGLLFDNSDNLLNPRQGIRAHAGATPYFVTGDSAHFLVLESGVIHYQPAGSRLVWANRIHTAMILGAENSDIPTDKQLFGGGGGSVRAYGHQKLGSLDPAGAPRGGRFLIETTSELRYMFTPSIEGVAFLEAGHVGTSVGLDSTDIRTGGGIGVRYHSPVGPIRADIALPFSPRPQDDRFQFYISIGQAF